MEKILKQTPLIIIAAILWIILGAIPIVSSSSPFPVSNFFEQHSALRLAGKLLLVGLLALATGLIWRHDTGSSRAKTVRYLGFALLTALLTDIHFITIDSLHMGWQVEQFAGILTHSYQPPDQYRFLSQGTLWWMTLTNGDFIFSYLAFRFCFTFLLCHAIYRLAACYLSPHNSVIVVFLYGAFYTLSIRYYYGNLLDPMSHLVMLTAFYYARQRQFWCFFWLLVLGVFIKETMLLLAPCYYLMNLENTALRKDFNWQRIILLGVVGLLVFFACRLPFHFDYNFQTLNRTPESMLWANLGIGQPLVVSTVPLLQRYLHPLLFLFMWLPLIIAQRRRLPASLFWTSLYFAAAIFATNTFFSWNHESRNYVPAFVLLVICTLKVLASWVAEPQPKPTEELYGKKK